MAYSSISECVEKLQFALANAPEPLTDQYRHILSWQGACERLVDAAAITEYEDAERKRQGLDKADDKAAQFHVDGAKRTQYVSSLFRGKILK